MAILADGELRALIGDGHLVEGGDLARASQCSYSFLPGAAFVPGSRDPAIVFPGADGKAEVVVRPGQMIWIRTRERVKIPENLVGFWWQTNKLSRQGLMLVNMSMVEPGYEGDLACLFVNFGKSNIPIGPSEFIAKMVFVELTGKLLDPMTSRESRDDYDRKLRTLAIDQPTSFLQVGDLMGDLKTARTQALRDIRLAIDNGKADTAAAGAEELRKFRDNIPGAVRSSFLWAAGALALITAGSVASDWVKGNLTPDTKAIARSAAEDALNARLAIGAAPARPEDAQLRSEIDALNKRIVLLERRK